MKSVFLIAFVSVCSISSLALAEEDCRSTCMGYNTQGQCTGYATRCTTYPTKDDPRSGQRDCYSNCIGYNSDGTCNGYVTKCEE